MSPEWLLANGTLAYLETRDPGKAESYGWQRWLGARDRGYTKDVVYEGFRYRKALQFGLAKVGKELAKWLSLFLLNSIAFLKSVFV